MSHHQNPPFTFTSHRSLAEFLVPYDTYISNHLLSNPKPRFRHLYVSALVFSPSDLTRILLVQRASTDSMPNLWEPPGGSCDASDPNILYSCARELFEEAGLIAKNIAGMVGDGYVFAGIHCKMGFLVDVQEGEVKLNEDEHQKFVWASEEECRAGKVGDVVLNWTSRGQKEAVMQAFEMNREEKV